VFLENELPGLFWLEIVRLGWVFPNMSDLGLAKMRKTPMFMSSGFFIFFGLKAYR
jgi:hypothetical protein